MEPVSPVLSEHTRHLETVIARDQPEYRELPAIVVADRVVTRWKLSAEEASRVLEGKDIYLTILTFGNPMQPVLLEVGECRSVCVIQRENPGA